MHHEYALDSLNANLKTGRSILDSVKFLCMDQFIDLALKTGDTKIIGICEDLKKCKQSKYKRPTDKQLFCVATHLLESNKTLLQLIINAFNKTEEEILNYVNEENLEFLLSKLN